MADLVKDFFDDMLNIYRRASKECNYKAKGFLDMLVQNNDPVQTAITLVTKEGGTEGFLRLWELNRLDLSVENLVLQDKYKELFSDEVREVSRMRLEQYKFRST